MTSELTKRRRRDAAKRETERRAFNNRLETPRERFAAHLDAVILGDLNRMQDIEEIQTNDKFPKVHLAAETPDGPGVVYASSKPEPFRLQLRTAMIIARATESGPPDETFLETVEQALGVLNAATEWDEANQALAWMADFPNESARYTEETGGYQAVRTELLDERCDRERVRYLRAVRAEAACRHATWQRIENQRSEARATNRHNERLRREGREAALTEMRKRLDKIDQDTNYSPATLRRILFDDARPRSA